MNVKSNKKIAKNNTCKEQKGITIIALVVTIIVMLILLGVSISMTIDGGLFSYAGKAVGDVKKSQITDEVNKAWILVQSENGVYTNDEIAQMLQEKLRKNESTAEVEWNSIDSKYEIWYKDYKMSIDDYGTEIDSLKKNEKQQIVLSVQSIEQTESQAKIVTIAVSGIQEMTDEIEKELEDEFMRQINEACETNYTYSDFCELQFRKEYLTLQEMLEFFQEYGSFTGIKSFYDMLIGYLRLMEIEFELPNKYFVTIKGTNGENYKILAIDGQTVSIPLSATTSFQVESNKYTSNVVTQAIENNETYSTIYAKTTEIERNGYKVTVPAGFAVGEQETTIGNVTTGLVITDSIVEKNGKRYSNGNEFVWIPVETTEQGKIVVAKTDKEIVKLKDGSTENYESVSYTFSGTSSSVSTSSKAEEPQYIEKLDIKYADFTAESLQEDYNKMVASIKKYGGFYVSRYELAVENNKPVTKIGKLPVLNCRGFDTASDWYDMYNIIKKYSNNTVEANMMWGSQWNAMLNFALQGDDKTKITSKNIGNRYSFGTDTSPLKTGCTNTLNEDKIINIYDLGGNLAEWTMEYAYASGGSSTSGTYCRAVRGGSICCYTGSSVASYNWAAPWEKRGWGDDCSDIGTRFSLYIK